MSDLNKTVSNSPIFTVTKDMKGMTHTILMGEGTMQKITKQEAKELIEKSKWILKKDAPHGVELIIKLDKS